MGNPAPARIHFRVRPREFSGLTQMEVRERYSIPKSTIEGWSAHNGKRNIANYLLDLFAVDIINERNNPAVEPEYTIE